jgi:hypothetical protein
MLLVGDIPLARPLGNDVRDYIVLKVIVFGEARCVFVDVNVGSSVSDNNGQTPVIGRRWHLWTGIKPDLRKLFLIVSALTVGQLVKFQRTCIEMVPFLTKSPDKPAAPINRWPNNVESTVFNGKYLLFFSRLHSLDSVIIFRMISSGINFSIRNYSYLKFYVLPSLKSISESLKFAERLKPDLSWQKAVYSTRIS